MINKAYKNANISMYACYLWLTFPRLMFRMSSIRNPKGETIISEMKAIYVAIITFR